MCTWMYVNTHAICLRMSLLVFSFLALRFPFEATGHFFAEPRLLQRWDQAFGGTIFKKRIIASRKKIKWYSKYEHSLISCTIYVVNCYLLPSARVIAVFFVLVLYYAILVWEKWCETGVLCSSAIWNMLTLICFKCFRTSWKRILAGSHRFIYLIKQRWFNGVVAKFYIDLITCYTMMCEKNNWFRCCRFCCWSTCYVLISQKKLE